MPPSRTPAALAASTIARVPDTLTASNADARGARVTPAAWTTTSHPSTARASCPGPSAASIESVPPGSGFVLPGRTMARTAQPSSRNASARCHPMKPVAPVMLTERLLIQAIGFVTPSADRFDASVDQVVVLQRPRHLTVAVAPRDRASITLGDQQRIEADATRVRHNA